MNTERYCETLDNLDLVKAVRAIQEAYLQIAALTANVDCGDYDNGPALASLAACLIDAGHTGFTLRQGRP